MPVATIMPHKLNGKAGIGVDWLNSRRCRTPRGQPRVVLVFFKTLSSSLIGAPDWPLSQVGATSADKSDTFWRTFRWTTQERLIVRPSTWLQE